jgi:hypothetical protein
MPHIYGECSETVLFEANLLHFWASEFSTIPIVAGVGILGTEGSWALECYGCSENCRP